VRTLPLCLAAGLLVASPAFGFVYSATGVVETLHLQDAAHGFDTSWLSLAGVKSLGGCKTDDAKHVVLVLQGEAMFELALESRSSGVPVTIWVDDTVSDASGFCVISGME